MQLQDNPYSLDRLKDIVQPDPVSWWPPAPLWYLLIAILTVWLLYWLVHATCRWRQNAYRRQALHELAQMSEPGARSVSTILKRVALVSYAKESVASLTGDDWLRFLNETCDGVDFMIEPACKIGMASFDPHVTLTDSELKQVVMDAERWVARHRVKRSP